MKSDKQKIKVVLILLLAFLIYSISSVIAKINSTNFDPFSLEFLLLLIIQIFLVGIYTVIWQITLKHSSLITAYSLKATTLVWSLILAALIFKENITINNIIGTIIIIIGIMVVIRNE